MGVQEAALAVLQALGVFRFGVALDNTNHPIIMAGSRELGHKTGQFVTYDEEKNKLANLFARIGNAMDAPMDKFGDSTGIPMSELFG